MGKTPHDLSINKSLIVHKKYIRKPRTKNAKAKCGHRRKNPKIKIKAKRAKYKL